MWATRLWHCDPVDEGEFRFQTSHNCIINYLKIGLPVKLNIPVALIDTSSGYYDNARNEQLKL